MSSASFTRSHPPHPSTHIRTHTHKRQHQGGKIGITINSDYKQQACSTEQDAAAAERAQIFVMGWFADPVFFGDYPQEMKQTCGDRLPSFTAEEKALLKGSLDFLGLNHYSTALVSAPLFRVHGALFVWFWCFCVEGGPIDATAVSEPFYPRPHQPTTTTQTKTKTPTKTKPKLAGGNYYTDMGTIDSTDKAWPVAESGWLKEVPWGFRKLLNWIKTRYDNPLIIVTENGVSGPGEDGFKHDEQVRFGVVGACVRA